MRVPGLGGDKHIPVGEPVDVHPTGDSTLTDLEAARRDAAYAQGQSDARQADSRANLRAADARAADRAAAERSVAERSVADRAADRDVRRERVVVQKRGGHPFLTLIVVLLALVGVAWIYLTVTRGSAQQGGAVIDNQISSVTEPVRQSVQNARDRTGQAVENAGERLKQSGEKIKQP